MNIYIKKREDPDDLDSGHYYIEDYEEIEKKHLDFMKDHDPPYVSYKKDYLRYILNVTYVGVAFLLETKKYEIKFLAKSDYVSCKQARNKIKSEIAKNRERRDNQDIEKEYNAFEKERKEVLNDYSFVVEGGKVEYNKQNFGKRIKENKYKITKESPWKIDVWELIARLKINEKYWYCCRFKEEENYIKEQLGL